MNAPFVIGIAGGSASGKSTFSNALVEHLQPARVSILPHDAYYFGVPAGVHPASINYDHPESLETALCAVHLRQLLDHTPAEIPVYDFTRHQRLDRKVRLEPAPYIIVEGILVLHEPALRDRMNLRVFVDTDDALRLQRRIARDGAERGRSEESVTRQWEDSVLPMHKRYVEPSKQHAHIIVDGANIGEAEVREITGMVHRAARLL